jgi:nucleoid-associated protein YgaU
MKKRKTKSIKKNKKLNIKVNYYKKAWKLLNKKISYFYLGLITFFVIVFFLIKLILPHLKFQQENLSPKNKKGKIQNDHQLIYQVKEGDTLWSIAEKFYGSGFNMDKITKTNKLDPNASVEVGQRLIIPKIKPSIAQKGETTSLQTNNHSYYIVKEGDFLWKIAETVYGDGNFWSKIIQVNQIADPNILIPGTKLIIPR